MYLETRAPSHTSSHLPGKTPTLVKYNSLSNRIFKRQLESNLTFELTRAFFFLFKGQYLKAFRMVQHLMFCLRLSCNMASNTTRLTKLQVIELFTFKPRRLGMLQNPNVECAQANFKEFVLWDLKFLRGCLKRKTGQQGLSCFQVSVARSSTFFLLNRSRKSFGSVKGTHTESENCIFKMRLFWVIKKIKCKKRERNNWKFENWQDIWY